VSREYEIETREEEMVRLHDGHTATIREANEKREQLWKDLDMLYRRQMRAVMRDHMTKAKEFQNHIDRIRMLLGFEKDSGILRAVIQQSESFQAWDPDNDGGIS